MIRYLNDEKLSFHELDRVINIGKDAVAVRLGGRQPESRGYT
jgi:hypothetical protein